MQIVRLIWWRISACIRWSFGYTLFFGFPLAFVEILGTCCQRNMCLD